MIYVIYCHYKHWMLAIWYIKQVKYQVKTHIKLCRNDGEIWLPLEKYEYKIVVLAGTMILL